MDTPQLDNRSRIWWLPMGYDRRATAADEYDYAARITDLQFMRRELLAKLRIPGNNTAEMKIRLDIVRAELHALYQYLRSRNLTANKGAPISE